ncbi:MAG: hypothetical protein ABSD98_18985 [Candidatus Korobacteraceae bacterium]|jgi:hypothetical protein
MRTLAIISCAFCIVPGLFAQNWKQVHRTDEVKWAKATGLDPTTIHKLWRAASHVPDEKDDDSRIANLDLAGLAERHDVLFVTYAGEKNCLTITVFRQLSDIKFSKLWSVEQPPAGTGFCDTAFGSAYAGAQDGVINVRVPTSVADGSVRYAVYAYEWNGITYRLAGQEEIQRR